MLVSDKTFRQTIMLSQPNQVSKSADPLKCVKIFEVQLVLPSAMCLGLCLFQMRINSLFSPLNNSKFYIPFTLHKASQIIKR